MAVEHRSGGRFRKPTVALLRWAEADGIADVVRPELEQEGYGVSDVLPDDPVPDAVDYFFSFGPYGRWLPIVSRIGRLPQGQRPTVVHWNFEGLPNPTLPWLIKRPVSAVRSRLDLLCSSDSAVGRRIGAAPIVRHINARMYRFRYLGDYLIAGRRGWLDVLGDISEPNVALLRRHGVPGIAVPWGTTPRWHADLGLDRDIDVLWMGQRRTRRRSAILDALQRTLEQRGRKVFVADGVQHPFIFDEERTRLLNRTKITLSLQSKWYDYTLYFRFHVAAGNRSLVVSEMFEPQSQRYRAGEHYVESSVEDLCDVIEHYLDHDREREAIVQRAYTLATEDLTLSRGVSTLMEAAHKVRIDRT